MSKETNVSNLQEQMNKVKQTLDQNPMIVFVTSIVGGISLAFGSFFWQPWYLLGSTIFVTCTTFSMWYARNAKNQYNELLKQLNVR